MGGQEAAEKDDDGKVSFSLRIPKELAGQIDARRKLSKRSRNMEIQLLLERQLDAEVERDKKIMDRIATMNGVPQNNQS